MFSLQLLSKAPQHGFVFRHPTGPQSLAASAWKGPCGGAHTSPGPGAVDPGPVLVTKSVWPRQDVGITCFIQGAAATETNRCRVQIKETDVQQKKHCTGYKLSSIGRAEPWDAPTAGTKTRRVFRPVGLWCRVEGASAEEVGSTGVGVRVSNHKPKCQKCGPFLMGPGPPSLRLGCFPRRLSCFGGGLRRASGCSLPAQIACPS